jgi:aminopeptidase YwaD
MYLWFQGKARFAPRFDQGKIHYALWATIPLILRLPKLRLLTFRFRKNVGHTGKAGILRAAALVLLVSNFPQFLIFGQTARPRSASGSICSASSGSQECRACIRAHEEFLASDALRGRGSATEDEWLAAVYVASQFRQYGIDPAGADGSYLQRAVLVRYKGLSAPQVEIDGGGGQSVSWSSSNEFVTLRLSQTQFSGLLTKFDAAHPPKKIPPGAVVLILGSDKAQIQRGVLAASAQGAAGEIVPAPSNFAGKFAEAARQLPEFGWRLEGDDSQAETLNILQVRPDAFQKLQAMPDGTVLHFHAPAEEEKKFTWNAVGMLAGRDPALKHSAVLLTAHLDHLGIGPPVKGDTIYNGADDDASGTTAVLELARMLGKRLRPRRTVIFALFGSEEIGGLGSTYFRAHPPTPLGDIAANLEFEMIGRADSSVQCDTLWLTGWERSNLGPALAAHGAHLVRDPHPEQNFFARSDNYILAQKGVVAQTVSSYGLHKDYHQPSDDLQHLDFKHMDAAIGSILGPIEWLVNSDFTPKWNTGGQPLGRR